MENEGNKVKQNEKKLIVVIHCQNYIIHAIT